MRAATVGTKRKEIELQDNTDPNKKIKLTLWKDAADSEVPPENTSVVFKNVYCKEFLQNQQLNSKQYTRLEVSNTFFISTKYCVT